MAVRPKAICRKVSCGALIDVPGYCAKHQQLSTGWTRTHGSKSSTERGYGASWQRLRRSILSRDAGLCQIRGPGCTYVAREVDHKISKANAAQMGWSEAQMDADSNLQSCCPACHSAKTAAERGSRF